MTLMNIKTFIIENDSYYLKQLNEKLNSQRIHQIMKKVTHLGDASTAVLYSIFSLVIQENSHIEIASLLVLSLVISQFIVHSMKRLINRKRPYQKHELIFLEAPPSCEYSLPSGHTACAITVALSFSFYFPKFSIVFISIGILVSFSRVILGYHYPTDIFIGGLISLLCHYISLIYLNLI